MDIYKAVLNGNIDRVNELIDAGVDVNRVNEILRTPLEIAIRNNKTEVALALIEAGADVNKSLSISGIAPLHEAIINNNNKID